MSASFVCGCLFLRSASSESGREAKRKRQKGRDIYIYICIYTPYMGAQLEVEGQECRETEREPGALICYCGC